MDEYRLLNKKFKKEKEVLPYKKIILSFINKVLICAVLFLIALIATKRPAYKNQIYKYVYSYNLSFSEIENLYQKYFGPLFPAIEGSKEEMVSKENFTYDELEEIEGGAKLKVGKSATITALESGLVIFVGEKENIGDVLIIEQTDGVEAWYAGVDYHDLKLYDYVEKDSLIASSKQEYISIYFKRKGEIVDYKNYIS